MESTATHANLPPRESGDQIVQSDTTGAGAASADLWGSYTDSLPPKGKVWLAVEAVTTDVYIRFTSTATTATTTANGLLIKAGEPAVKFFVQPNTLDAYIDHIAPAGAGLIKWYVCSNIVERNRI